MYKKNKNRHLVLGKKQIYVFKFQTFKKHSKKLIFRTFSSWIEGAEAKCKVGYSSPNSQEEATTQVADCKAWKEMCEKVDAALESGKASAQKMTLHDEQDKLYTEMKARWTEVDKSCKEWTKKLEELSGMWTKQTGEKLSFKQHFFQKAILTNTC